MNVWEGSECSEDMQIQTHAYCPLRAKEVPFPMLEEVTYPSIDYLIIPFATIRVSRAIESDPTTLEL